MTTCDDGDDVAAQQHGHATTRDDTDDGDDITRGCLRSVMCHPWGRALSFGLEKPPDGAPTYTRLTSKSIKYTINNGHCRYSSLTKGLH